MDCFNKPGRECPCDGVCVDANRCIIEELENAGYEVHKKGEVEQVQEGETVATRLRLGDSPRGEQGDGNQGGVGSNQEGEPLTAAELAKLRKHMRMWPG